MPPKNKFTNNDIIDAAFKIVREKGLDALTARAIAEVLQSSTKPIYSQIESMEKVQEAIIARLWELFFEYMTKPITGDAMLDYFIGYVFFALKEKHLFHCFYDERFTELHQNYVEIYEKRFVELFSENHFYKSIPEQHKKSAALKGLISLHGFADMLATYARKEFVELRKDENKII